MRLSAALVTAASLALLAMTHGASAMSDQGAQLAAACASCHRLDGGGTGIPAVVGLDQTSITQAMLAYRSGARASQVMQVVARALTPEQIASVARYLASLKAAERSP